MTKNIKKVCAFCASSDLSDKVFLDSAFKLGEILADNSIDLVYGGGTAGCMGRLADGALSKGGNVYGIIPKFMFDLEWGSDKITELKIVDSLSERKEMMIEGTDATIVLPGGSGTLEELFEVITLKRLGLYLSPIILVNTKNFFDPCLALLDRSIKERFMDERNGKMWEVVASVDNVLQAIEYSITWSADSRKYATLRNK
ncbi:MAG TPA: TIGR00730 family Rossman fold protein [Ignavibacteriaceae bacterium]|nr:TIGR00730 family Rossman fold protein [Ignavibacteriaceae bacterium]